MFRSLRGYPERRGGVEAVQRGLAATFQQCHGAAYHIADRLIRNKVWKPGARLRPKISQQEGANFQAMMPTEERLAHVILLLV